MPVSLIILAAGQGTRMDSRLPKALHPLGGVPMLAHAMACAEPVRAERVVVITGYRAEEVGAAAHACDPGAIMVRQAERLGTAHAVEQARGALSGFTGDVIVLLADTPFFRPEITRDLLRARETHDVVFMGFEAADPGRYGRFVMQGNRLRRIVEFAEATGEERQIRLCNTGVVAARADVLFSLLAEVQAGAGRERYLTDIAAIADQRGLSVGAAICAEADVQGVNSRAELARAEGKLQTRLRTDALQNGVTLIAPETVTFARDTCLARDTVIEPHVVFGPGVTVDSGATIRAFSHLEGCHVAGGAVIGPYARLRPGTQVAAAAKVGNFVEIKNAALAEGAKVNHLSYIGDARIGAAANIGAGTVTCNYDGVAKHHTEVGARAFIGSDTMLVAPVKVGEGAMTASGSVITRDVPEGALAIGRARQENKPGLARKLLQWLAAGGKSGKSGTGGRA